MRLAIATVSNRDDKPEFRDSREALIDYLHLNGHKLGLEGYRRFNNFDCSKLPSGRQWLQDHALRDNFTHLLWLDNDMLFKVEAIVSLIRRNVDAIGVNYVCKSDKVLWFTSRGFSPDGGQGHRIDSRGKTGIEEVFETGLGICLVRLDAIRHIPAPHFEMLWDQTLEHGKGDYRGEDYYYTRKLRAHGIKLHIDHDASQLVSHIGSFKYGIGSYPKDMPASL